ARKNPTALGRVGLGCPLNMSRGAQTPRASETITSRTVLPPPDGGNGELHGVRKVDELPLEVELLRQAFRQRLDPDSLRRVMARGDEMDSELARGVQAGLGRLAGQEQVVALAGGVGEIAGGSARDHGRTLDALRSVCEHDRVATQLLADPGRELVDRDG